VRTPDPTSARPECIALDGSAVPSDAGLQPEDSEHILWPYTGEGSVCFFPPGSLQEHLVTEHGIDSLEVLRKSRGFHDHAREHSRQLSVHPDTLGDLIAVDHVHEAVA
jgi:hypothetical protein